VTGQVRTASPKSNSSHDGEEVQLPQSKKCITTKAKLDGTNPHRRRSWHCCSWGEQESLASDDEDAQGDGSLYHVLDGSIEGEENSLDVSDSKRLSLMDILLKEDCRSRRV